MAATPGSIYQIIREQHIANIPPNADPQRTDESFPAYQIRMAAQGLPVDINATESDADYLVRLASYRPAPPYEYETSSYALRSGTANSATTATNATTAALAAGAISAETASRYVLNTYTASNASVFSGTASYAILAEAAGGVMTNAQTASYLEGARAVLTAAGSDAITIDTTTERGILITTTGTGQGIYSSAVYSQGVVGVQAKVTPLAADINVGAIAALRSIYTTGSQAINAAVLTVTDQYGLGDGGLLSCTQVSTEVFKVDKTGSLWASGSKGYTGTVNVLDGLTMSFQGGIITGVSA